MPELPGISKSGARQSANVEDEADIYLEVERARKLIADSCTGYTIKSVDTTEDKIVYAGGITHEDYASLVSA